MDKHKIWVVVIVSIIILGFGIVIFSINGGVTVGKGIEINTQGTEITKCGFEITNSGRYYLKNAITFANQERIPDVCIEVTASNVIIDCHGLTMFGTGEVSRKEGEAPGTIGINASQVENLRIEGCTIKRFRTTGIKLEGVSDVIVSKVNIHEERAQSSIFGRAANKVTVRLTKGESGLLLEGDNNNIINNTFTKSNLEGNSNLLLGNNFTLYRGIVVKGNRNRVDFNNMSLGGLEFSGQGGSVSYNEIPKSLEDGISVLGNEVMIKSNDLNNVGKNGISVLGAGHIIDSNKVALDPLSLKKDLKVGIDVQKGSQRVRLTNNRIFHGWDVGMRVQGEGNSFTNNRVFYNKVGISFEGKEATLNDNFVCGNTNKNFECVGSAKLSGKKNAIQSLESSCITQNLEHYSCLETQCSDGKDNDNDRAVDCFDVDCVSYSVPQVLNGKKTGANEIKFDKYAAQCAVKDKDEKIIERRVVFKNEGGWAGRVVDEIKVSGESPTWYANKQGGHSGESLCRSVYGKGCRSIDYFDKDSNKWISGKLNAKGKGPATCQTPFSDYTIREDKTIDFASYSALCNEDSEYDGTVLSCQDKKDNDDDGSVYIEKEVRWGPNDDQTSVENVSIVYSRANETERANGEVLNVDCSDRDCAGIGTCAPLCDDSDGDGYGAAWKDGKSSPWCSNKAVDCRDSHAKDPAGIVCPKNDPNDLKWFELCKQEVFSSCVGPKESCVKEAADKCSFDNICKLEKYSACATCINPTATEVCHDGVDNDCDGLVDEQDSVYVNGVLTSCVQVNALKKCQDVDGDGYCENKLTEDEIYELEKARSNGAVNCRNHLFAAQCKEKAKVDCDDNRKSVYPGAAEICGDGIDNNCDGNIDDKEKVEGPSCNYGEKCEERSCSALGFESKCQDKDNDGFCSVRDHGLSDKELGSNGKIRGFDCSDLVTVEDRARCPTKITECSKDPNYASCAICINPSSSEICGDGTDNDCDGKIDQQDSDCSQLSCGHTITTPGVTILRGNLACKGNGIKIGAPGVVLDCGRSTIQGDGTGIGIDIQDYKDVEIKNCVIKDFSVGIAESADPLKYAVTKNNIHDNIISNNAVGIEMTKSRETTVFNNKITGNDKAIFIVETFNSKIKSNEFCSSNFHDIECLDSFDMEGDQNKFKSQIGNCQDGKQVAWPGTQLSCPLSAKEQCTKDLKTCSETSCNDNGYYWSGGKCFQQTCSKSSLTSCNTQVDCEQFAGEKWDGSKCVSAQNQCRAKADVFNSPNNKGIINTKDLTVLKWIVKANGNANCGGDQQTSCPITSKVHVCDDAAISQTPITCKKNTCFIGDVFDDSNKKNAIDTKDLTALRHIVKANINPSCGGKGQASCPITSKLHVCDSGILSKTEVSSCP